MLEYSSSMSISKLMGVSSGYVGYDKDYIFNKIRNNTFNILVLDNYEETCDEIKKIFREIFETGQIRDNKGNLINFNNTMIFIIEDTLDENIIGFTNNSNKKETYDNYDLIVNIPNLTKQILINYLDTLKINNNAKEKIINESNYQKYNYKKVAKLITNYIVKV